MIKPTPVKLPEAMLKQVEIEAKTAAGGNRSAVIREAITFYFKYKDRMAELQRPPVNADKVLPWVREQHKAPAPIKAQGAVWRPPGSRSKG